MKKRFLVAAAAGVLLVAGAAPSPASAQSFRFQIGGRNQYRIEVAELECGIRF